MRGIPGRPLRLREEGGRRGGQIAPEEVAGGLVLPGARRAEEARPLLRFRHVRRVREGREEVPAERGPRGRPLPRREAARRGGEAAPHQRDEPPGQGLGGVRVHEAEMEGLPGEEVPVPEEVLHPPRLGALPPVPRGTDDLPEGLARPVGGLVVPPGAAELARLPDVHGRPGLRRKGREQAHPLGLAAAGEGGEDLSALEGPDRQRPGREPDGVPLLQRGRRGPQQPDQNAEEDIERVPQLREVQEEDPPHHDLREGRLRAGKSPQLTLRASSPFNSNRNRGILGFHPR